MADIDDLTELWARSERVVVLSGAGMSTDSGIPDFRGPSGLWTKDPSAQAMFDIDAYMHDPDVRRRAWVGRREHPAWAAEPNAAHGALTDLQRGGRLGPIITQNIDGLHQLAGADPVLELHGTIWDTVCMACGAISPTLDTLERSEDDPRCLHCGGILKTATISFGQRLDAEVLDQAITAARTADLLVAVGTTLQVMPAAALADMAAHLAIVNADPTPYDAQADAVVREPIGSVLPEVRDGLLG
ncbi:MAG: Sir2 family NAD-dependent protein deacetylase [Candidatus Nanopelagicales bacterium]